MYLCRPLQKKWIVLKIIARNLAEFFVSFLFTKNETATIKFGRNKKASTFALPIQKRGLEEAVESEWGNTKKKFIERQDM